MAKVAEREPRIEITSGTLAEAVGGGKSERQINRARAVERLTRSASKVVEFHRRFIVCTGGDKNNAWFDLCEEMIRLDAAATRARQWGEA